MMSRSASRTPKLSRPMRDPRTSKSKNSGAQTRKSVALKLYGVLFYDSFASAKHNAEDILQASQKFDQLNVVIKEEGNMGDPELKGIAQNLKIFAGDAWHLIHTRRKDDGW